MASGIVDKVQVSINYASLSATIHIYGARLIFARTEEPEGAGTDDMLDSFVEQEIQTDTPQEQKSEVLSLLDQRFKVSFKVTDTSIVYNDFKLEIPSLELNVTPFIATASSAMFYYKNALFAQVTKMQLDREALCIGNVLLLQCEIPPALLIKREHSSSSSDAQPILDIPGSLSIQIERIDGYLLLSTLQESSILYFFSQYTQLSGKTIDHFKSIHGLPAPFTPTFLELKREEVGRDALMSDILSHMLHRPHLKACLRGITVSSGLVVSIRIVEVDEWVSPSNLTFFSPYIPIIRFTSDEASRVASLYSPESSESVKYSYEYQKESDESTAVVVRMLLDGNINVELSSVHVLVDFDLLKKRITKLLTPKKKDVDASEFYTAHESFVDTSSPRILKFSLACPLVRMFVTCPDYVAITNTRYIIFCLTSSSYKTQSSLLLFDLCKVSASLTHPPTSIEIVSEMIGFSIVDSLNGSDRGAWSRSAKFTATPVLSCVDPCIDIKLGKSECVIERVDLSPVSGGRTDDWTEVLSKSKHEGGFEFDDGDVLVNGSGSERSEDEREFGGFLDQDALKGMRDSVGRVVKVKVPLVRSCVGKKTVERVQYVWSCISWYLNSGFGSQDVFDFPEDLDDVPDVDDTSLKGETEIPEIDEMPEIDIQGDDSDDFYSAYGGSVFGAASSAFHNARTSPLPILPSKGVHTVLHTDSLTPSSNGEMDEGGGVKCLCVSIVVENGIFVC